ncbi:hypothetical protein D5E84_01430 [Vibrio parahaemolyticus]|nr:hypothetical protein D5E84_01430 [Vibrio parahaemolyticus]
MSIDLFNLNKLPRLAMSPDKQQLVANLKCRFVGDIFVSCAHQLAQSYLTLKNKLGHRSHIKKV